MMDFKSGRKKSGMGSCCNGGAIRIMERKGTALYSHIYLLCNIGLTTGGEKRYTELYFQTVLHTRQYTHLSLSESFP